MSEIEAIEYRIAQLFVAVVMLGGIMVVGFGGVIGYLALIGGGEMGSFIYVAGGVFLAGGYFVLGMGYALSYRGYCRTLFKSLGKDFDDPPLDEWSDRLEDKNAFPVDGETND